MAKAITPKDKQSPQLVPTPINDLTPSEYNPRINDDEGIQKLMNSMQEHGFVGACIVNSAKNRKNIIIAGHTCVEAARRLGMNTVPVFYVNEPDIEREKALNIRLNRHVASWDWEKLRDLFEIDLLEDVGFESDELSIIFDDALETEDDQFNTEEELKAIKEPKAKIGDLYQLGAHRLIVGDSTDPEVVRRLMGGEKVSLIDTDPPFSIGLDYDKGISGKKNYGGKTNDKMSEEEYTDFLHKLIANAKSVAKDDAHYLFWCDQNWIWRTQTLYQELGIKHQRVCWWLKGNFMVTPNVAFNKAGEAIVYGIT